ncbi:MAG: helix-turn-helix transcriptional regulator, partial [Thermoanaerobaculia bacterium]|nr:helix-turn-helix transcriptional regulator [Thermoanaerobaculia bacterium]
SLPLAEGIEPNRDELRWLGKVQREIQAQSPDPAFSVEDLAERLAVHRSRLHHRLRELTGFPPSRLISHWRLSRAADLLRQREGNVSEVAYAVGFRSVEHFSRTFRKNYGQSPSAFRRTADSSRDPADGVSPSAWAQTPTSADTGVEP